jgi:replicative DNA helicase
VARSHYNTTNPEWMTCDERKFLFELGLSTFKKNKSILDDNLVKDAIINKISKGDQKYYLAEWSSVKKTVVSANADALKDLLKRDLLKEQGVEIVNEVFELIEKDNVEEAILFLKKKAMSVGSVVEQKATSEFEEYVPRDEVITDKKENPQKYLGLATGFKKFDKLVGGFFANEKSLFAAVTGTGKSTILKAMGAGVIKNNYKKNVLHVTNEESKEQVEMKYDALFSGIPYNDFKRASISDSDRIKWKKDLEEMKANLALGKLYIKEIPAYCNALEIENAYRELEQKGIKIDMIVLDYLDRMKPIEQSWSEYDESSKSAADIKELTRILNIPIITATQGATVLEEKQNKGKQAGNLDVYGGKGKVHHSNTLTFVTRDGRDHSQTDREEWQRDWFWNVSICKNRDGPAFSFRCRQIVQTGQVVEEYEAVPGATDPSIKGGGLEAAEEAKEMLNMCEDVDEEKSGGVSEEVVEEERKEAEDFKNATRKMDERKKNSNKKKIKYNRKK